MALTGIPSQHHAKKQCLRRTRSSSMKEIYSSSSDSKSSLPSESSLNHSSLMEHTASFIKTRAQIGLKLAESKSAALHSSENASGRSSVISTESDDSGLSSHPGEVTPQSETPPRNSTLCIPLQSPVQSGILQVIPDIESQGHSFIGFFKPLPTKDLLDDSFAKISRSTKKYPECNVLLCRPKTVRTSRKDCSNKITHLTLKRKLDSSPYGAKRKKVLRKKISKKAKTVNSTEASPKTKRRNLLKEIQHHNRSPERPSEQKGRLGRTRSQSHAKILFSTSNTCTDVKIRRTLRSSSAKQTELNSSAPSTPEKRPIHLTPSKVLQELCADVTDDSGLTSDDQSCHDESACHWRFCKANVSITDLPEHLDRLHVGSQRRNSKVYRCYWDGCKVYGKVAKSLVWLEGHVKKHLGSHPYHCIFEGCVRKFSTQELLQRHVDSHFTTKEQCKPVKKCEASAKKGKISTKRLKGTKKCIPIRSDFFTGNIIEAVHWEQKILQDKWQHLLNEDRNALILSGRICSVASIPVELADGTSRTEERVQIHWYPEELSVPDSWHLKSDPVAQKCAKPVKFGEVNQNILFSS